jgi:transposase
MAYLWVMSALSLPRIQDLVRSFRALKLSTAGISKMMIRLSGILQPDYDEILEDLRQGARIWADETGWRVRGKLWWLWIFAHERSAYYWADKTRGSPVVAQILVVVFYGILIADGWHAYTKIVCDRQTCMAHIFRKIRAFIDAYPQYRSLLTFYLKLRKIIRDVEKLQAARAGLDEMAFHRRLKALERRLDQLLNWKNPNDVLKEVIKKVRRQKEHILTFVHHDGAPHHKQLRGVHHQEGRRKAQNVGREHVARRCQGLRMAILVDRDAYLLELCRYVVLNPVRARLVEDSAEWPWSSYAARQRATHRSRTG